MKEHGLERFAKVWPLRRRSRAGRRSPMRPTKRCFARGRWGRRRRGQAMFDIAMPLFENDDVKGIRSAVDALGARKPRPVLPWSGR